MSQRISGPGWVALVVLAAATLLSGCGGESETGARRIVLVTVDGLIPAEISIYGGELSMPHLEELADAGAAWNDVWTPVPMSRPAVASYLTGLAPDRHGVRDDVSSSLDPGLPTLARLLSEAGYETAAFPGSSLLGFQSGLLDGFGVVDDPPDAVFHPGRRVPHVNPVEESAGNFASWLDTLPDDRSFFAWVHFAHPMRAQLLDPRLGRGKISERVQEQAVERGEDYPTEVAAVDAGLGTIVAALETRDWLDRTLVIVAGTSGDLGGGDDAPDDLFGVGYSLHEKALQVPLVVRGPSELSLVASERPVWALDVPATVAELTGVSLAAEAEGTTLRTASDPQREMLAFSWATLDEMAWPALRAARVGPVKAMEGVDGTAIVHLDGGEVRPEVEERLTASLATRREPPAQLVELDAVLPFFNGRGIEFEPMTPAARQRLDPDQRHQLLNWMARARGMAHRAAVPVNALRGYVMAYDLDPESPAVLVERGQLLVLSTNPKAVDVLNSAVRLYPRNPDAVHWYAHMIGTASLEDTTTLLEAVRQSKPDDGDVLYDLACMRSLDEDLEAAEDYLKAAIEAGFRDFQHMETDADLRNLRESGRFAEVVAEYSR